MANTKRIKQKMETDFQHIFESVPGMCLLLDKDFIIVNATDSYLRATMTKRAQIARQYIFDVFPDDPDDPGADGVVKLQTSLNKVLKTGLTDKMAVQKYNIRKPMEQGGAFEERYWSPHNAPVLGKNGEVEFIIHCVMDVTDVVKLNQHHEQARLEVDTITEKLEDSRTFLKNILNTVVDPIFVKDRNHSWLMGNNALWDLFGRPEHELIGKSDYDFFPKEEADVFWQTDEEVFTSGQVNVNIENFTDASGKTHIISTKKSCFTLTGGEQVLVGIIRDITDVKEMEKKLRESDQARLKAIMDHSGCIMFIKDLEGRHLQANKNLLALMELPEEQVLGKNDYDLFPNAYADAFRRNDLLVIEDQSSLEFEEAVPHKDGVHTYRSVKFPLFNANGEIYAVCGIATDVTERKEEEAAAALLASIVTSSDDAIISKTLDGIITTWNSGAQQLFGYTPQEAVGHSIELIIPEDKVDEEEMFLAKIRDGTPIKAHETTRMTKEGKIIHVSLTASPVLNSAGQIIGASKVARDITRRKEVETKLLRYMWELERSNQELDDFAYIASHDLKEPLRGVFNHASFLLEDYKDKLNEEGIRRISRLSVLAQRMEQLINDLLYFSRLGRTQLAVCETDPNQMVEDIKQMLDGTLQEYNADITIKGKLPTIICDRPRMTEVFRNLITNAIKYNDKPERHVEVGYLPQRQSTHGMEKHVFYVKDNGIGIDPEFHAEIFRIFKRLNKPANEKETGTGVGLTFVKKIIERHSGTIWLESALGEGSTFYFTIGEKNI